MRNRPTKRGRWRWVTRQGEVRIKVWPGSKKPVDHPIWGWTQGPSIYSHQICAIEWKDVFGIDVPTDRPIKVLFSARKYTPRKGI